MKNLTCMTLAILLAASTLPCLAQLIQPDDRMYQGAFRLPDEATRSNWEYSGYAMTYHPDGAPNGPDDGHPGSLFVLGHDHQQYVSEISIPGPVISNTKDVRKLNTATTLQGFHDITGGMYGYLEILFGIKG